MTEVDGHSKEIMQAITWWSQTKEKEEQVLRAEMSEAERRGREQGRIDGEAIVKLLEAAYAPLHASMRDTIVFLRETAERDAQAREELLRHLQAFAERWSQIGVRDDFHASRLHRVEVRTDRLEDRLYHNDKP